MSVDSIREKIGRIKGHILTIGSEWLVALVVILVGICAFTLGYLSAQQGGEASISVSERTDTSGGEPMPMGGMLVASVHGSKYHFPWCSGAQRMNEENKIWFDSSQAARGAGYEPAENCAGLE